MGAWWETTTSTGIRSNRKEDSSWSASWAPGVRQLRHAEQADLARHDLSGSPRATAHSRLFQRDGTFWATPQITPEVASTVPIWGANAVLASHRRHV